MRPRLATALLASAATLACLHGKAELVRMTADGGALLLEQGSSFYDESEPVRDALQQMQVHCAGPFEVTAIERVPVSPTSTVRTMQLTYLCRTPTSTVLNDSLLAMVKRDEATAQAKKQEKLKRGAAEAAKLTSCQRDEDCAGAAICYEGRCR